MNTKIDPLNLRIGSKIKLPVGSGIKIHYVKKGDTLGNIAGTYNSTVYTIAERNYIVHPDLIYTGDILAITKSTDADNGNLTKNAVSQKVINAIVNDLNQSELNKYSTLHARYENGWIKIDNINFNLPAHKWAMSIVDEVLDNYNVKIVDYTAENVIWDCPDGDCTGHWGTVCIKVEKNKTK